MKIDQANQLLSEYITSPSLLTHSKAVSISLKSYASLYKEDENLWEITGLLHDLDYEKYPEVHPVKCIELLTEMNESQEMIHAIAAHADQSKIESLLDKTLFACDEMSGFVYASVLVRPNKLIDGLEPKSVIKKIKDKAFAKNVSRDDLYKGADLLQIELSEHIQNIINAFISKRDVLGI